MSIALLTLMVSILVAIEAVRLFRERRAAEPAREPQPVDRPWVPYGTFLTRGHSWLRFAEADSLAVGVDSLVAGVTGEVRGVELVAAGTSVERGAPVATLVLDSGRLVVRAPTDGEVVAVNQSLKDRPGVVGDDPYGLGWLIKMRPRDHKAAIEPAFIGHGATAWVRREYSRLVDMVTGGQEALADGASLERGLLHKLDAESLAAFQEGFMDG